MDALALKRRFGKAGLKLEILKKPLNSSNPRIFQMDIGRKASGNVRAEWFSIWPGDEGNRIEVLATDAGLKQLVLMINEPERTFNETFNKKDARRTYPRPDQLSPDSRIIKETEQEITIEKKTSAGKAHYLCGKDERNLFIAGLSKGVPTVREAHSLLRPLAALGAKRKTEGRVARQGEWFFLNITKEEEEEIEKAIGKVGISRNVPISISQLRPGKPSPGDHVAQEAIVVSGEMYVRGRIRHRDHKTLTFKRWRKFLHNLQSFVSGFGRDRIFFID